jgi:protocatechuate 4,5-dioxygenase alpha chain
MLIKLGATVGEGLYHMGAQQRGESYEEFMATRNASGAR